MKKSLALKSTALAAEDSGNFPSDSSRLIRIIFTCYGLCCDNAGNSTGSAHIYRRRCLG